MTEPSFKESLEAMRDLPVGQHPFDFWLIAMEAILGRRTAERFIFGTALVETPEVEQP